MENLILVVHVVIAICIVGLILLQQGKGAEMGASFGSGASQTVFGSVGSGNFFSRMTAVLAAVFFATSFSLAVLSKQGAAPESAIPVPVLEQQGASEEQDSDVPTIDDVPVDNEVDTDIPAPPAPGGE